MSMELEEEGVDYLVEVVLSTALSRRVPTGIVRVDSSGGVRNV